MGRIDKTYSDWLGQQAVFGPDLELRQSFQEDRSFKANIAVWVLVWPNFYLIEDGDFSSIVRPEMGTTRAMLLIVLRPAG